MDEQNLTFNLGPDEIGKLFRMCSERGLDREDVDTTQRQMELLLDHLSCTIDLSNSMNSKLSADIRHLYEISGISTNPTIRELLTTPQVRLRMIRKLKRIYQDLFQSSESKAEKDVATAIYYAAIGNALIQHKKRITSFSYKELAEAFAKFSRISWVSQDLRQLYKEAQRYCLSRADADEK